MLEFLDLTVILGGLIFFLLMFFLMYLESFRPMKRLHGIYRDFEKSMIRTGIFVDLFGIFYYTLRLIQWQDGLTEYIAVDIFVVVASIGLFFLTYPFFLDAMEEAQSVYGETDNSPKH